MSHKAWQNAHAMYENDACAKALGIDIISMDEGFCWHYDRHRTNA